MSINKPTNIAPFIAILLFSTILLVACSSQPEATPTLQSSPIEDGLGRELILDEPAQRVVSLAPSNTEILFAVGAGDQVIGRDEFSDYPDQANTLPSVGGGFGDYNLEAIVDLEPDLVLAAEINTPEQVKSMEDLTITDNGGDTLISFGQDTITLNGIASNALTDDDFSFFGGGGGM